MEIVISLGRHNFFFPYLSVVILNLYIYILRIVVTFVRLKCYLISTYNGIITKTNNFHIMELRLMVATQV